MLLVPMELCALNTSENLNLNPRTTNGSVIQPNLIFDKNQLFECVSSLSTSRCHTPGLKVWALRLGENGVEA